MAHLSGPQLSINYAPELDFALTCVGVQKYEVASPEYRFQVRCRVKHPTGHFEYFDQGLCFEPDSFAQFAEGLRTIQRGTADTAALKDVGEMLVFQLDRRGRQLRLSLSIREFLPPGHLASLGMAVDVDYDLFVNKLRQEVEEFIADLREVSLSLG